MRHVRFDTRIKPSQITPESRYLGGRRRVLGALGGIGALGTVGGLGAATLLASARTAAAATPGSLMASATRSAYSVTEAVTPIEVATTATRFRELEPDIARNGEKLITSPWEVRVEGECLRPRTFGLEELLTLAPMQERIYRMLCTEGFLHVVPYIGYPLAELLRRVEPTGNARFVEFTSVHNPVQLPGQRDIDYIPWPYVEGLRIDEAMHPLSLVALGAYGTLLPKGLGAPIAVRMPWKFGTKSPKSVVRIRLLERQPATVWNSRYPRYHSFWGNINPAGATNLLGRGQRERKAGDLLTRATPLYNGYAEHVASMYAGMDPAQMF